MFYIVLKFYRWVIVRVVVQINENIIGIILILNRINKSFKFLSSHNIPSWSHHAQWKLVRVRADLIFLVIVVVLCFKVSLIFGILIKPISKVCFLRRYEYWVWPRSANWRALHHFVKYLFYLRRGINVDRVCGQIFKI